MALGGWFELEMKLLTAGAEERRRPALVAYRDRARPRLWDRHLVVPTGMPDDPKADVAALDELYREGRAERWAFVAPEGPETASWEWALGPFKLVREPVVYLEREASEQPFGGDVRVHEREDGLAFVARFRSAALLADRRPPSALPAQLASALRLRAGRFGLPVVLGVERGREPLGMVLVTALGERAWLEDLEVHPRHRRSGLGRTLFRAALEQARRMGASTLGFSARQADWPLEWYRREGFRPLGRAVRLSRVL